MKTTTIEKEKELKEKQDNSEEVVKENSDSNEAGGSEKEGSEKEGSEKEEIPVGEEKKDGNTNEDKDINEDKTNDNDKSNDTKLGNANESDENQNEVNELNAVNVDKEDTQEIAEIITEKNENELKTDQLEAIEKTLIDKPTLQGYGYFTETASKTDLFYIIDIAQKVLFAYDYKQMDLFSNVAVEETLTEVERTPTSSYNFANGSVEVSRVSYTSLHSESAIKISFTETEVVLILCPSNSESKQREEEFGACKECFIMFHTYFIILS